MEFHHTDSTVVFQTSGETFSLFHDIAALTVKQNDVNVF